jgi:hypothetical protein
MRNLRPSRAAGRAACTLAGIAALPLLMAPDYGAAHQDPAFTLNADGELVRPIDYRSWVFVGSPVTPNDLNDGAAAFPEFHNVYIDPVSYETFKRTGKWREGTVMLKELVSVGAKAASSGRGYFQGEFLGLEASIKSSQHFGDEPGGWAYFSFTNKDGDDLAPTSKAFPSASCNACHQGAAKDDFVFTQYYPVLRAAKSAERNPENSARRRQGTGR